MPITQVFISLALFLSFRCVLAADPDPLQDFCIAKDPNGCCNINGFPCKDPDDVTADDFSSTYLRRPVDTNAEYGVDAQLVDVTKFPGLNTQGVSFSRIYFEPRSLNVPHVHPRSSEVLFVHSGSIFAGIVTIDNKFFGKLLKAGDLFVNNRGLVHFQYNPYNWTALVYAGFNSQRPGRSDVVEALFNTSPRIMDQVLAQAFQTSEEEIEKLRKSFS